MTHKSFLDGRVTLHHGDCRDVLDKLPADSIDSCVTDPPYHLQSIHKRFAARGRDETSERYSAGPYGRHATGFMGKQWDGGDVTFQPETWCRVWRVLKPGAHLVAFGGTRTYHRMVCAIEDAGFEIRDCIMWVYGSGFPKSHDLAQALQKQSETGLLRRPDTVRGVRRIDRQSNAGAVRKGKDVGAQEAWLGKDEISDPVASQWEGWGTALKPAVEPIVVARKPLSEGTVAANVLRWGTGAINIDGCRVDGSERPLRLPDCRLGHNLPHGGPKAVGETSLGRWPANFVHDGSDEVLAAFPETESGNLQPHHKRGEQVNVYGVSNGAPPSQDFGGDSGSAARFFYAAKADADDRAGSKHPTVKPLDLKQWLCRLVTPKGGTVLDPFAGTGTTGEAAWREGFNATLIEADDSYCDDIRRRMALALASPAERIRESVKARGQVNDDPGPLFAFRDEPE